MTHATLSDAARSTLNATETEILRSLRFDQMTVQVHDARVVQIERTEKIRPESVDARAR